MAMMKGLERKVQNNFKGEVDTKNEKGASSP